MLHHSRRLAPICLFLFAACGMFGGDGPKIPRSQDAWIESILSAEDRRDADDPLLALALEHDDSIVRAFAYRALERIGDPGKIALILAAARREPDAELRAKAILAIAGTESGRILDAVESFVLDPAFVTRRAVARAIGRAKSDQAIARLFGLMSDSDPDVRAEAAHGIGRRVTADPGAVDPRSLPAFRALAKVATGDTHAVVRAAACYAVGRTNQPEFAPDLAAALADADPVVRTFAAAGLQSMALGENERSALRLALADREFTVVVEAARALERDASEETVAALAALLTGAGGTAAHDSHHVRAAAAKALGGAVAPPARDAALVAVRVALSDPSPSVRADALESLVALATVEEAIAACDRFAAERDGFAAPFLRSRAAAAAARIAGEAGYPIVERLLSDSEPAVKAAALATLPKFASRRAAAETALEAALAFPDVAPRESAATAIAELRLSNLAPRLMAAFEQSGGPEFIEARIAILRAIGSFGKFGLVESLERALDDEEPEVRRVAADEIAKLGGLLPRAVYRVPPASPATPRVGVDLLTGDERPRVEIVTTRGPFTLELLVDDAPRHARVFLDRCRSGFYDGRIFHRLVPGFVVQGLDPRGDGYGVGGASLRSEVNEVRFARGVVGMPDAGKDTGGCQIFVTFRPQPRLDDRYTIFARVVAGMENVERLDVGDRVLYVLLSGTG